MSQEKLEPGRLTALHIKAIIATALYVMMQWGAFKTYGVLLEETGSEVGIPYHLVGVAFALPGSLIYIMAPISHKLVDTFPVRWVCFVGGILAGGGYVINACFQLTFWNLLLSCSVTGFGFGLQSFPVSLCQKEQFGKDYAKYQCIALPFMYVGMSILPIVLERLVDVYGIQGAVLIFGGLLFHTTLVGIISTRGPHKDQESQNQSHGREKKDSRKNQESSENAMLLNEHDYDDSGEKNMFTEEPRLVPFLFVYSTTMFLYGMWAMFLVPFAQRKGYELSTAVFLSTFGGFGGLVGKLASIVIYFYEMNNTWTVYVIPCTSSALVLTASVFYYPYWFLVISSFISGFGIAVVHAAIQPTLHELVPHHFSKALNLAMFLCAPGTLTAGFMAGYIREESGNYDLPFLILSAVYLVVAVIMFSLGLCRRYEREDIT